MRKAVAVSALCLLGVLYVCAMVDASSLQWVPAGTLLPCRPDWDCQCIFNQKRGCCCVANEFFALENSTCSQMRELSKSLSRLQEEIKDWTGRRNVAFTATLKQPLTAKKCFGPFTSNVPIPYDHVTLNDGNGYNSALGAFTAPYAGTYSFSFTVFSDVSNDGGRMYYHVRLMKDGKVVMSTWEDNREDSKDSATQVVVLPLERGSQVYVELQLGRILCDPEQMHNVFSGYLLYPAS